MDKQELIKRIQKGAADENDLFAYYGVRNIDGFVAAIEDKTKTVKVNIEYLNGSFEFIFKARLKEEGYNPLEEKFYYYSMVLSSLYGFDLEEINIIITSLGLFKTSMLFDKIFKEREEVKYFDYLYKMYLDNQTGLKYVLKENADKLIKKIFDSLEQFKMEDLEKISNTVLKEIQKISKED
jgi:hypothetical protein